MSRRFGPERRFGIRFLSSVFATAIRWLGEAAVPMLLLLVGATIADQLRVRAPDGSRGDAAKVIAWSCLLRLGLLPMAFLAVAALVPASPELRSVIVVQAAMPSAVFPVLLAKHYGGHPGPGFPEA